MARKRGPIGRVRNIRNYGNHVLPGSQIVITEPLIEGSQEMSAGLTVVGVTGAGLIRQNVLLEDYGIADGDQLPLGGVWGFTGSVWEQADSITYEAGGRIRFHWATAGVGPQGNLVVLPAIPAFNVAVGVTNGPFSGLAVPP